MVEEIKIGTQTFRGIFACPSVETPWKICISFVPGSWKTWSKYATSSAAEAAWKELKTREADDRRRTPPEAGQATDLSRIARDASHE